jgi:hypothetical protein
MIYDVIIIGGGPSGLMAANVLQKHKLNYLILEKNDQLAKKLKLTGGKRCNVTNNLPVDGFIEALNMKHRRFLYHALKTFGPEEIIAFFKQRGLGLLLEQGLKYFPETHLSQSVLDALLHDIDQRRILFKESVKTLVKHEHTFEVVTANQTLISSCVIVATGSKAYPTTGSSGDGVVFAKNLGLETIPFTPAETHVYVDQVKTDYKDLQGVTISQAELTIEGVKKTFPGGVLFTHFGLSGPAVLHASEVIAEKSLHEDVYVHFPLTEWHEHDVLKRFDQALQKNEMLNLFLEEILTKRLSKKIVEWLDITQKRMSEYSKKDRERILDMIFRFRLKIDRVETIERAFVNAGGVSTKELDPKTMMVKRIPGLYFVGETTDLQGPIGGFNLTIAFSTGHLAAEACYMQIHLS